MTITKADFSQLTILVIDDSEFVRRLLLEMLSGFGVGKILLALLILAMISMGFDRGFSDPAVSLWMVMLGVQSIPYAATFATATISALSNQKPHQTPVAPPVLSKAA